MAEVVQPVTFVVDARPQNRERWITISAVDAGALMQQLPAAIEITARIAKASSFDLRGESGGKNVDVGIGEDQLLLDALARMERRGPTEFVLIDPVAKRLILHPTKGTRRHVG